MSLYQMTHNPTDTAAQGGAWKIRGAIVSNTLKYRLILRINVPDIAPIPQYYLLSFNFSCENIKPILIDTIVFFSGTLPCLMLQVHLSCTSDRLDWDLPYYMSGSIQPEEYIFSKPGIPRMRGKIKCRNTEYIDDQSHRWRFDMF